MNVEIMQWDLRLLSQAQKEQERGVRENVLTSYE
jgi:hypothetical protein